MPDNRQDLAGRVTELEITLAHQQRLCEQLNEVVTDQTRTLLRFREVVQRLEDRVRELGVARKTEPEDPSNERPPHY